MKRTINILLAIAGTVLASGCNTIPAKEGIAKAQSAAVEEKTRMAESATTAAVTRTSAPKLAGTEIAIKSRTELPGLFKDPVVYISHSDDLTGVLTSLTQQTGIQIVLSHRRPQESSGAPTPSTGGAQREPFPVDWRGGSLKALLDHISQKIGMHWRYHDGRVEIINNETRSFHVYVPGGSKTVTASIALSGSGAGGGGGAAGGGAGGAAGGAAGGSASGGGGGGPTALASHQRNRSIRIQQSLKRSALCFRKATLQRHQRQLLQQVRRGVAQALPLPEAAHLSRESWPIQSSE